jgi:hypothetical protein
MTDVSGDQASPSGKIVKINSGDDLALANGATRGLLVGVAGTATVIDMTGATLTNIPLQQGYNPLRVRKVTFGSCSDVWGLY